ncbi:MAG: helix-turn-helix transcriptional regulator [Rikenellaceae bacterium]
MTQYPRLTPEELKKIRQHDFSNDPNFTNAETVLSAKYGEIGTQSREDFQAKAKAWYYGEILREKRKELKMTQKQLAERIGRERTYVNRIEQGETDIQLSTFIRITEALGIDISLNVRLA